MAAKALLKAATEAFEAGDYKGVLTLVPSDDDRPYPLLVCRGMAALQLKEWKVRGPPLPSSWRAPRMMDATCRMPCHAALLA